MDKDWPWCINVADFMSYRQVRRLIIDAFKTVSKAGKVNASGRRLSRVLAGVGEQTIGKGRLSDAAVRISAVLSVSEYEALLILGRSGRSMHLNRSHSHKSSSLTLDVVFPLDSFPPHARAM